MDFIVETLIELIVDGSMGTVSDRKAPGPVRIMAALILFLVFGGLFGLVIFYGIKDGNWILAVIAAAVFIVLMLAVLKALKKRHSDI